MPTETPYVEWSNRMLSQPGSLMEFLGLRLLEADEDHLRMEVTKPALTPDGSWGGEALDAAMAFAATGISLYDEDIEQVGKLPYMTAARTVRYLRRTRAKQVFINARVLYRNDGRILLETVAEDDAGRQLIRSESELLPIRRPAQYKAPSE